MIARKELSEPSMEIVFESSRDKKAKTPWRLLGLTSLGLVLVGLITAIWVSLWECIHNYKAWV